MKTQKMSNIYPNIDMQETGTKLRRIARNAGYSVKDIQEYLHLSCPQPVYRWFNGTILPTVDHLYMLSILFDVHMEELLVPVQKPIQYGIDIKSTNHRSKQVRLRLYQKNFNKFIA